MSIKSTLRQGKRSMRALGTKVEVRLAPKIYGLLPGAVSGQANYRSENLIIAAPGNGNIGDQAMLDAYLEGTSGHSVIIVRKRSDITVNDDYASRVQVIPLDKLVYGSFNIRHLHQVKTFKAFAKEADRVAIIGADIMDGAYNSNASVRRSNLAHLAAIGGADTRVLGFSWNASPDPSAVKALWRASSAGVRLLFRDPLSYKRGKADGLLNCYESADIVFTSMAVEDASAQNRPMPENKPLALVNISAHIQNRIDQRQEYVELVKYLQGKNYRVLLVPHVSRPDSDDVALGAEVWQILEDSNVGLLNKLLSPAQIRSLCRASALIVTGRMHLAVIGLSQGVPSVILASQGKVEGLAMRFPGSAAAIQPQAGMRETICARIEEFDQSSRRSEFRSQIEETRALALRNFA